MDLRDLRSTRVCSDSLMYMLGNMLPFFYTRGPGGSTVWILGNTGVRDETVIREK